MLSQVTFPHPPFGIVTIPSGKLGYKRKTTIRLRRSSKYGIYFPVRKRYR